MPEQPLVSAITAFYNPGPFLREAIASVLAQTYSNWEYFLVNDGSNDGSAELARSAASEHPDRIHCVEHPGGENRGVCTSRNLALQHATGQYIAILDADDVWFTQKLQEQVAIAQQFPEAGVIFGNSRYWKSWTGSSPESDDWVPPLAPGDKLYEPGELLRLNYLLGPHGAPCPSDFLIRTEACRSVGGFEEHFNRYQVFEDQAFLAKLYLSTSVYVSTCTWDYYRIHENSCCSLAEKSGRADEARRVYLDWLRDYMKIRGVADERLWRAWNRASLRYRHPALFKLTSLGSKLRRGLHKIRA